MYFYEPGETIATVTLENGGKQYKVKVTVVRYDYDDDYDDE